MERHSIPRYDIPRVGRQDPPVNGGAVLSVWLIPEAGLPATMGEGRIEELFFAGNGHTRKPAPPRTRRLGKHEEARYPAPFQEIPAEIFPSYGVGSGAISIRVNLTVRIEQPIGGRLIKKELGDEAFELEKTIRSIGTHGTVSMSVVCGGLPRKNGPWGKYHQRIFVADCGA